MLPATTMNVSMFDPRIHQSLTTYDLLGRQKRAIIKWDAQLIEIWWEAS
jgi:hypothetical protein